MMKEASIRKFVISATFALCGFTSVGVNAQQVSAPIVCPGYEPGKNSIPGERVGTKLQKAFESFSNELVDEAIAELRDIKTKIPFDRAYVDRFLGNMLAGQEGKGAEALVILERAAAAEVLNDSDQAPLLKLVADLSLQEKDYQKAIGWYNKWIDFTCKQDTQIYMRIANSYYELKEFDKVIEPADKSIAAAVEPNKNAYILKMSSFYERKLYKESVEVVETIVQIFPDDDSWWTQLGFLYMLIEDFDKALSTFEICYNRGFLTKENQVKALAQLYGTQEIPYKAAFILDKYINNGLVEETVANYVALANSWQQARNFLKAAENYGKAAKLSEDPEHYRRQGILLLNAEKYKEASVALEKSIEKGVSKKGRVHIALMEASYYLGNFKQAYTYNQEAQKDKDTRSNARAWEAFIKDKAKNRGIKI